IVKNIIREEDIDGLVVGLPVPTQSENQNFKNVQSFIEKLEERLDLPVQIIDESYTSKESQRLRAESGTDVPEDALAAMMILQEYLDKRS
ncbi:MAG: RuvX/YqgF family protein, partial [Patescibacteria group bacterium]